MPCFYFDVNDGETITIDEHGMELADLHAARFTALDTLPDIARQALPNGDQRTMVISVRDQNGRTALKATLRLDVEWLIDVRESPPFLEL